MKRGSRPSDREDRDRYTEYADATGTVGMVYDTQNDDAWIRSTHTLSVGESTTSPQEAMRYDSRAGAYRIEYDWTSAEPLSTVVVTAVADLAEADPLEMEPLYDSVDPDALDRLFGSGSDGPISFSYRDHDVTIERRGRIVIRPPETN